MPLGRGFSTWIDSESGQTQRVFHVGSFTESLTSKIMITFGGMRLWKSSSFTLLHLVLGMLTAICQGCEGMGLEQVKIPQSSLSFVLLFFKIRIHLSFLKKCFLGCCKPLLNLQCSVKVDFDFFFFFLFLFLSLPVILLLL